MCENESLVLHLAYLDVFCWYWHAKLGNHLNCLLVRVRLIMIIVFRTNKMAVVLRFELLLFIDKTPMFLCCVCPKMLVELND